MERNMCPNNADIGWEVRELRKSGGLSKMMNERCWIANNAGPRDAAKVACFSSTE